MTKLTLNFGNGAVKRDGVTLFKIQTPINPDMAPPKTYWTNENLRPIADAIGAKLVDQNGSEIPPPQFFNGGHFYRRKRDGCVILYDLDVTRGLVVKSGVTGWPRAGDHYPQLHTLDYSLLADGWEEIKASDLFVY